jgi:hypothetical protein
VDQLQQFIRQNWFNPVSGVLLPGVVLAVFLALASQADFTGITTVEWIVGGVLAGLAGSAWWLSVRPRRHKKGTLGFDIAIRCEVAQQSVQLENDFVDHARKLLQKSTSRYPISLLSHPQHISARVRDSGTARRLTKATRGKFLLFGQAKERMVGGEPQHVLEFEGLVRHGPIGADASRQLANEFREAIPSGVTIQKDADHLAFRVTAEWVNLAARYVVALASRLSGDDDYAESLFLEIEQEVNDDPKPQPPSISRIRNRLPQRLFEVYQLRCAALYERYWSTRDVVFLKAMEPELEKALSRQEDWDSGWSLMAIVRFMVHRDIPGTKEAISHFSNSPDTTWRYSAAFIAAYEGDLQTASEHYRKVFYRPPEDETVPIQSEEFIQIVVEKEPERCELHFCLGLINLKAKKDRAAARRDFQAFLSSPCAERFPQQRTRAEEWIGEIDRLSLPAISSA